jgi:hypothetical protein
VSGAAIAGGVIVAGALTGGVAIGAVIAIGGAAYAIKKGIERYHSYERNAELRQRWILLGSEYTRLSAEEQAKKRTKLCEVTSADAKDCIRKCVVHLRKALDHYNSALKTPPVGEALTCDDAVTRAKPIFKFIHEYDKFRSYLLPNLLAASTMIEDYHKMSIKWRQTLREVELKLGTHMVRNSHSQCTVCYNRRTAPAAAPARTAAQFDIVALAAQIPEMFNELVAAVAVSKTNTRSGGAGAVSGNAEKRWKKFRDDLLRRYDEPSRGRQVRHFVANRNLATDPSEKVAFAVGQLLDVGSAAGSPFMAGLLSTVAKGAVSAGTQLVEVLAGAGIAAGGSATNANQILLRPANVQGPPLDTQFASDEDVKKAFKYDAIAAEKLIGKISTHWQEGMDSVDILRDYLTRRDFYSCDEAMNMAIALAEFVHHFSKMEKYLLAYYIVVARLMDVARRLVEAETAAYNRLDALKPQVTSATHHQRCRDHGSACYGPKILTSGVLRKTIVGQLDGEAHKPL